MSGYIEEEEDNKSDSNMNQNKGQSMEAISKLLKGVKHEARVGHNYQCRIPEVEKDPKEKDLLGNYRKFGFTEIFLAHRINEQQLEEYLELVRFLSIESKSQDYSGLITNNQNIQEKSLHFLHQIDYSIIKAKFYLIFPSFLKFNQQMNCANQLMINEKQMELKIQQYLQYLKEDKITQHEKWRSELNEILKDRIHVNKLQVILEQGKQMKFEIPEQIKEFFDKSNKLSKEIRKQMANKQKLEKLIQLSQQANEHQIITDDMVFLEEGIRRSQEWLAKTSPHWKVNQRIPYKILQQSINEYNTLPIIDAQQETLKEYYKQASELIEKIQNLSKQSKTRNNNAQSHERIDILQAQGFVQQIIELPILAEEFDNLIKIVEKNKEYQENCNMFLEDERVEKTTKVVLNLNKEALTMPFYCPIYDKLSDLGDYLLVLEKIKKMLKNRSKLNELSNEVKNAKARFMTNELQDMEEIILELIQFYEIYDNLMDQEQKELSIVDFFYDIHKMTKLKLITQDQYKKILDNQKVENYLDKGCKNDIDILKSKIEQWEANNNFGTIESIIEHVVKGFQFNIQTNKLIQLMASGAQLLKWYLTALKLIKKYIDEGYQASIKLVTGEQYEVLWSLHQKKIQGEKVENNQNINEIFYVSQNDCDFDLLHQLNQFQTQLNFQNVLITSHCSSDPSSMEIEQSIIFSEDILQSLPEAHLIRDLTWQSQQWNKETNQLLKRINLEANRNNQSEGLEDDGEDQLLLFDEEEGFIQQKDGGQETNGPFSYNIEQQELITIELIQNQLNKCKQFPTPHLQKLRLRNILKNLKWVQTYQNILDSHNNLQPELNRVLEETFNIQEIERRSSEIKQVVQSEEEYEIKNKLFYQQQSENLNAVLKEILQAFYENKFCNNQKVQLSQFKQLFEMGKKINLKDSFPNLYENFESVLKQCSTWQSEFQNISSLDKKKIKLKKDSNKISNKNGEDDDQNKQQIDQLADLFSGELEQKMRGYKWKFMKKINCVSPNLEPEINKSSKFNMQNINKIFDVVSFQNNKQILQQLKFEQRNKKQLEKASQPPFIQQQQQQQKSSDLQQIMNSSLNIQQQLVNSIESSYQKNNQNIQQQTIEVAQNQFTNGDKNKLSEDDDKFDQNQNNDLMELEQEDGKNNNNNLNKKCEDKKKKAFKQLTAQQKLIRFYYYYKYPIILTLIYQANKLSVSFPEFEEAIEILCRINIFLEKYRQLSIEEIQQEKLGNGQFFENPESQQKLISYDYLQKLIREASSLNCYLIELSKLKSLEKWAVHWLDIANSILAALPKAPLYFKNEHFSKLPCNFSANNYSVAVDVQSMEITFEPKSIYEENVFVQQKSMLKEILQKDKQNEYQSGNAVDDPFYKQNIDVEESPTHHFKSSKNPTRTKKIYSAQQTDQFLHTHNNVTDSGQKNYISKRQKKISSKLLQSDYYTSTPPVKKNKKVHQDESGNNNQNANKGTLDEEGAGAVISTKQEIKSPNNKENKIQQKQNRKLKSLFSKNFFENVNERNKNIIKQFKKTGLVKKNINPTSTFNQNSDGEHGDAIAPPKKNSIKTPPSSIAPPNTYFQKNYELKENKKGEKWCICRRGDDGIQVMIECSECKEWFHNGCISLEEHKCDEINQYICIACCMRKGLEYTIEYKNNQREKARFKWYQYKKLKLDKFLEILHMGNQIPLYLCEKVQLNKIKQQFEEWVHKARLQLSLGFQSEYLFDVDSSSYQYLHNNEKIQSQQIDRNKELFKLILESLYFPFETKESEEVLLVLQTRDTVKKINNILKMDRNLKSIGKFINRDVVYKKLISQKIFSRTRHLSVVQKSISDLYNKSREVAKKLDDLERERADYHKFKEQLNIILQQNLLVEKASYYKSCITVFENWQIRCINLINSKGALQDFKNLTQEYEKGHFICTDELNFKKIKNSEQLGFDFVNRCHQYINGASSQYNPIQLLQELQNLPVIIPPIVQQWLIEKVEQFGTETLQQMNDGFKQQTVQQLVAQVKEKQQIFTLQQQQYNQFEAKAPFQQIQQQSVQIFQQTKHISAPSIQQNKLLQQKNNSKQSPISDFQTQTQYPLNEKFHNQPVIQKLSSEEEGSHQKKISFQDNENFNSKINTQQEQRQDANDHNQSIQLQEQPVFQKEQSQELKQQQQQQQYSDLQDNIEKYQEINQQKMEQQLSQDEDPIQKNQIKQNNLQMPDHNLTDSLFDNNEILNNDEQQQQNIINSNNNVISEQSF